MPIHRYKDSNLPPIWKIENDLPYSVPVDVKLGDEIVKVEMREGAGSIKIPEGVEPVIDPNKWITVAEKKSEQD